VEPACSNIAVQRTANDHTSYMTRVRAKYEMDVEIPKLGLPGHRNFTNSNTNTRTWGITRDGQGCHHLPPTPQLWGTVIFEGSHAPKHHAHVQGNYPYPLGTLTLRIDKQEYGKPEGTTNHHLNPSCTSTHTSHMNVEA
jgi:hypothetical protein